jgi:hypothetical protein
MGVTGWWKNFFCSKSEFSVEAVKRYLPADVSCVSIGVDISAFLYRYWASSQYSLSAVERWVIHRQARIALKSEDARTTTTSHFPTLFL